LADVSDYEYASLYVTIPHIIPENRYVIPFALVTWFKGAKSAEVKKYDINDLCEVIGFTPMFKLNDTIQASDVSSKSDEELDRKFARMSRSIMEITINNEFRWISMNAVEQLKPQIQTYESFINKLIDEGSKEEILNKLIEILDQNGICYNFSGDDDVPNVILQSNDKDILVAIDLSVHNEEFENIIIPNFRVFREVKTIGYFSKFMNQELLMCHENIAIIQECPKCGGKYIINWMKPNGLSCVCDV
jgi:hypothetical protein